MPKPGNKRRKPSLQISIPARHAVASAKSRSRQSGEIPYKLLICQSRSKVPCSTVLSVEEEAVIVAFRKHTLLPLDD